MRPPCERWAVPTVRLRLCSCALSTRCRGDATRPGRRGGRASQSPRGRRRGLLGPQRCPSAEFPRSHPPARLWFALPLFWDHSLKSVNRAPAYALGVSFQSFLWHSAPRVSGPGSVPGPAGWAELSPAPPRAGHVPTASTRGRQAGSSGRQWCQETPLPNQEHALRKEPPRLPDLGSPCCHRKGWKCDGAGEGQTGCPCEPAGRTRP